MAELHVQPKKTTNWWLWLIFAVVAIAVIFFLSKGCERSVADSNNTNAAESHSSDNTGSVATTTPTTNSPELTTNDIDFNAPAAQYEEITDKDINVRGNDNYTIYSLGKNILFDVDKSAIRSNAGNKLKQIASSLGKRYPGAKIDVYGYADSTGDAGHNKQLSEQRAEAVKNWIIKNAHIEAGKIQLHPMGESNPVASNATEQGKQENRSVQIVARK